MAALREVVAEFSIKLSGLAGLKQLDATIDGTKKKLHGTEGGLMSFGKKLEEIGKVFATAFAAREIKEFFKTQIDLGNELQHTAEKTGLSTNQIQKLQYAADQADISSEGLIHSMGKLQMQLGGGMGDKGGPAIQALAEMGIKTKDLSGKTRDLTEILGDAADAVKKEEDPNKRVAVSMQLFGKSGRDLLPLLLQGKEGINKMGKEAEKLGFILGQDFIEASAKADEEQKRLNWSMRTLKATVAGELFPAMASGLIKMQGWIQSLSGVAKHTTIVQSGTTALSLAMGFKLFGSMGKLMGVARGGFLGNTLGLAKAGLYAAGVAGVALAFDDLFALFKGKKSLVGEVMDKIGGKGMSTGFVKDMTDAWNEMSEALTGNKNAASDLDDVWQQFKSGFETLVVYVLHVGGKLAKAIASLFEDATSQAGRDKISKAFSELGSAITTSDKDYGVDTGNKGKIVVSKKAQKEYGLTKEGEKAYPIYGPVNPKTGDGKTIVVQHITVKHVSESKDAALKAIEHNKQDMQNSLHATRNRTPAQGEDFVP